MSASNQQTLADSVANERPPMLEKENYIPWESRFRRFLDIKLEEGERMWHSIEKGPYVRPMIPDPDDTRKKCGNELKAKEGESLESVYERLTTLVNIIDHNNVRPIPVSINTKFVNFLQPEWSKYVTMSHASPSYSNSPQPYYVTHPLSVVDYEEDYQWELQGNSEEDKLTTAMINQVVLQDGRVDIQTKNTRYGRNGNRNAGRQNRNQAFNCYNCNEKGHYARDCQKPRVCDAKYFREQMLFAMKDEAGSNLKDEENDFMLNNSYGDETLEELIAAVIMMARIQPADDNAMTEPNYDAKAISEVNASHKVHEQANHVKRKTIIHTSDDD
ncbi:putative ribonuclease H-like domain-containing protein [Tanacetum coccineum]